jgi:hypothetical protein
LRSMNGRSGNVVKNDKGFTQPGGGRGKNMTVMPRQMDGDEVGKVCDVLLVRERS